MQPPGLFRRRCVGSLVKGSQIESEGHQLEILIDIAFGHVFLGVCIIVACALGTSGRRVVFPVAIVGRVCRVVVHTSARRTVIGLRAVISRSRGVSCLRLAEEPFETRLIVHGCVSSLIRAIVALRTVHRLLGTSAAHADHAVGARLRLGHVADSFDFADPASRALDAV